MDIPFSKSLVLVDDEIPFLDMMSQILGARLSCPVHVFSKPAEALEAIPSLNPGIIITDYSMPQMNGVEFIRAALKIDPTLVFIVLTGHGPEFAAHRHPFNPAIKAVLNKPAKWQLIASTVLLHWHGSELPTLKQDL